MSYPAIAILEIKNADLPWQGVEPMRASLPPDKTEGFGNPARVGKADIARVVQDVGKKLRALIHNDITFNSNAQSKRENASLAIWFSVGGSGHSAHVSLSSPAPLTLSKDECRAGSRQRLVSGP
jgi:hypothetical protein